MTRKSKTRPEPKSGPQCNCPVSSLTKLSADKDGFMIYYCRDHMEFRKPGKETRQ